MHVKNDHFWYREEHGSDTGSWHALPDTTPTEAAGMPPPSNIMQAPDPGGLWTVLGTFVTDKLDYAPMVYTGTKRPPSASTTTAGGHHFGTDVCLQC